MQHFAKCFQIESLPDLALIKYKQFADNGVRGVIDRQGAFLRQWNRILLANQMSMHLIYCYMPNAPQGNRMGIYLLWLSDRKESLEIVDEILPYTAVSDFYQLTPLSGKQLFSAQFASGATAIKRERTVPAVKADSTYSTEFYMVPPWKIDEDARLVDMMKMLFALGEATGKPCAYRVDLYATDCSERMRASFQQPLRLLYEMRSAASSSAGRDVDALEGRDDTVNQLLRDYENWQKELDTNRHFRMNVYAFADSDEHAEMILSSACAEVVREGDCDILPIKVEAGCTLKERLSGEGAVVYSRRAHGVPLCDPQRWPGLDLWSTLYTCKEAAAFFRLPALYEGEEIGLRKESAPRLERAGLLMARDQGHYDVRYPIANLCKHTLICGVPGAGKTNTMLHLITSLWKEKNIPFLVFEPAKKEYRAMFNDPQIGNVMLFSPGVGSAFPLMVNPFEFPKGMVLSEHISMLLSIFEGTFEMQGSVRFFLDESIEKAYYDKGWKENTVNDGSLPYPTLKNVYDLLSEAIEKTSYDKERQGNFRAFLQVRLGGLLKRDAGRLFDVSRSTLAPEEWLNTPSIIEMETLGDQAKNFLILVLCTAIMESLRVDPYRDMKNFPDLRHVIFIEEAHNLIADVTEQPSQESVNPKISATAFLVKMLAEVRALREGIVITDQLPSVLAPEVIKNTSLKIVHRMTSEDDRKIVCGSMSATSIQMNELPVYGVGEALIFYEKLLKPFKGRVCQWSYPGAPQGNERYVPKPPKALAGFLANRPDYRTRVIEPARAEAGYRAFIRAYTAVMESTHDVPAAIVRAEKEIAGIEAGLAGGSDAGNMRVKIMLAGVGVEEQFKACKEAYARGKEALKRFGNMSRIKDEAAALNNRCARLEKDMAKLEQLQARLKAVSK